MSARGVAPATVSCEAACGLCGADPAIQPRWIDGPAHFFLLRRCMAAAWLC